MPRPPPGFLTERYPLRHRMVYSTGFNALTSTMNSSMFTFVKNYKSVNNPDTINVNPHHASFKVETGAICAPMSIIDRIKIIMHFTMTEDAIADGIKSIVIKYMPIFTVFGEKLDSVDSETTTTAKALLELTKDTVEEDITPLFTNVNMPPSAGASNFVYPASTTNFTEVFGTMDLETDKQAESIAWDNKTFFDGLKYYTNKGAIQSMVGKQRTVRLNDTRPTKSIFINKFVPRAVRRIQPYSFFGMLIHMPLDSEFEQPYYSGLLTTNKAYVGVKAIIQYDEWNSDHLQEMM